MNPNLRLLEKLSPQEIAIIVAAEPDWVLPMQCSRRRERMAEGRRAVVSVGTAPLRGFGERRAIAEAMEQNRTQLLPWYLVWLERYKRYNRKSAAARKRRLAKQRRSAA